MEYQVKQFVREEGTSTAKPTDKVFKGPGGEMYSALELEAIMTEPWSNGSCRGYAIMAMERSGMTQEKIKEVMAEIAYCFDDFTLEEANQHWVRSQY